MTKKPTVRCSSDASADKNKVLIKSSNALTCLKMDMSKQEYDIMFFILHHIKDGCMNYSLSTAELTQILGKEWKSSDLKFHASNLFKHCIYESDGPKGSWEIAALFEDIAYRDGELRVSISRSGAPYFFNIKKQYTLISYIDALHLGSKYSKRLYWLLSQWFSIGGKKYSIADLRELMGIDIDSYRKKSKAIRTTYMSDNGMFRKVINDAVVDININADIYVNAEWTKSGRAYSEVFFSISPKVNIPDNAQDMGKTVKNETFRIYGFYKFIPSDKYESLYNAGFTLSELRQFVSATTKTLKFDPGCDERENSARCDAHYAESFHKTRWWKSVTAQDRKKKKETAVPNPAADSPREAARRAISMAVASGVSITVFSAMMEEYGFTEDEFDAGV